MMMQSSGNLVAVTTLLILWSSHVSSNVYPWIFGFVFILYSTPRSIPERFINVQVKLGRQVYFAANVKYRESFTIQQVAIFWNKASKIARRQKKTKKKAIWMTLS